MKYSFGKKSKENLIWLCKEGVEICELALSWGIIDFMVFETLRKKAEQNIYFKLGKSRVAWPNSTHNLKPGKIIVTGMDNVPYVNGKPSWDRNHCLILDGVLMAAAAHLGYKLRSGSNWDMDGEPVTDQDFQDLAHSEVLI